MSNPFIERLSRVQAKWAWDAEWDSLPNHSKECVRTEIRAILLEMKEAVTEEMIAALAFGYLSTLGPDDGKIAFLAAIDAALKDQQ